MRRPHGSGSIYFRKDKQVWIAQLKWNGKLHTKTKHSKYDAHVALMELRHQRDREEAE